MLSPMTVSAKSWWGGWVEHYYINDMLLWESASVDVDFLIILDKTVQRPVDECCCLSQDLKEVPKPHDTSSRRSRSLRQGQSEVDCHFALLTIRGSKCLNGTKNNWFAWFWLTSRFNNHSKIKSSTSSSMSSTMSRNRLRIAEGNRVSYVVRTRVPDVNFLTQNRL